MRFVHGGGTSDFARNSITFGQYDSETARNCTNSSTIGSVHIAGWSRLGKGTKARMGLDEDPYNRNSSYENTRSKDFPYKQFYYFLSPERLTEVHKYIIKYLDEEM